ncbi:MAG TPA: TIM barrel protein [Thermoproteota archaeon]|nr:TIM barrel protein [Thermoproteota archaeon]
MLLKTVFGPAGYPIKGPSGPEAMAYLAHVGLLAMEYQSVRSVRIGKAAAQELGQAARKNGIVLTMHGPYAISLSSEDRKVMSASKDRLVKAAIACHNMGGFHLTFHAGFYGRRTKQETFELQLKSLGEVIDVLKSQGVHVELGPETTGKESQFGTLDELLELSGRLHELRPTVDFGHIHVRNEMSRLNNSKDFLGILSKVENSLGSARTNALVLHFSEVQPTASGFGERRHWPLGSRYGPKFEFLADAMAEVGFNMVVICESPRLDEDALKMKDIFEKRLSISRNVEGQ